MNTTCPTYITYSKLFTVCKERQVEKKGSINLNLTRDQAQEPAYLGTFHDFLLNGKLYFQQFRVAQRRNIGFTFSLLDPRPRFLFADL